MAGHKVILIPEDWSDVVAADLEPVMLDPDVYGIRGLERDVKSGDVAVFGIYDGDQNRTGSVTLRVDTFPYGKHGVIQAAHAAMPGVDLSQTVVPYLEQVARENGACAMRIHTQRPGLVRKFERRLGYRLTEYVIHKPLVGLA